MSVKIASTIPALKVLVNSEAGKVGLSPAKVASVIQTNGCIMSLKKTVVILTMIITRKSAL